MMELWKKYSTKRNFIILVAVLLFLVSAMLIFQSKSSPQAYQEITSLAADIRNSYKDKPNYAGLQAKKEGVFSFVIGDENGEAVSFGGRSFYIIINDISKKDCENLLGAEMNDNLSLVGLKVNSVELAWGNGLPLDRARISYYCNKSNKMSWVYN